MNRNDRVPRVVLAAEEARLLQLGEAGLGPRELLVQLGPKGLVLLRQLGKAAEIVDLPIELPERLELSRRAAVLCRRRRRSLLVVPEPGLLHLRLEPGNLAL